VPLIVIQRQLGHSNLGITSIYLQGIDNGEIIETVYARRAPMIQSTHRAGSDRKRIASAARRAREHSDRRWIDRADRQPDVEARPEVAAPWRGLKVRRRVKPSSDARGVSAEATPNWGRRRRGLAQGGAAGSA
jgi:hypothetical protein